MTNYTSAGISLILIEMGTSVPGNAIGYVQALSSPSLRAGVEADCLNMLTRHCPELVARYRSAKSARQDGGENLATPIIN